jgi:hypothetical protein
MTGTAPAKHGKNDLMLSVAALVVRDSCEGATAQPRPRSADQAQSPAAVSQKREYFKDPPETIGDFSPEAAEFGAQRPVANLQKPAIGGHFWHCWGQNL